MLKNILIILLSISIAYTRDNPFDKTLSIKNLLISNNKPKIKEYLYQKEMKLPSKARVLKSVILNYQNLDGSIESININIDKAIVWGLPIIIKQNKTKSKKELSEKFIKVAEFKFLKFQANYKAMKIIVKDQKIRDFLLTNPHRIVIDFKKDLSFYSKKIKLKTFPFKSILIGNHDKFYRIVIQLDGIYSYTIKEIKKGYIVEVF